MPVIIGLCALLVLGGIYVVMSLSRFREGAGAMEQTARELLSRLQKMESRLSDYENRTDQALEQMRREDRESAIDLRSELARSIKLFGEIQAGRVKEIGTQQNESLASFSAQLTGISRLNEEKLESVRAVVEQKLSELYKSNEEKLEKMRMTVDEQLHSTLEKRLGEAFATVSERLEQVHKGLGEMCALTSDVGDLKKVLSNVKVRGMWGEMQLGALLEQILTKKQYEENVITKPNSSERVEFAIILPGHGTDETSVKMPIDSKFPIEDYQRLITASEQGDTAKIAEARKALRQRVLDEAKDISNKYLEPPYTTDFGILYLPVEGLYAEVLRIDGLCDRLSREFRVIPAGPVTICALLNSLQMGFRTLAIEKRSSEVWALLGTVKSEFIKFGDVLARTRQKIDQAGKELDKADTRTKAINRALSGVQQLSDETVDLERQGLLPAAGEYAAQEETPSESGESAE